MLTRLTAQTKQHNIEALPLPQPPSAFRLRVLPSHPRPARVAAPVVDLVEDV